MKIITSNIEQYGFKEFWKTYPRKINKKKCIEIWKREEFYRIAKSIISDVELKIHTLEQWKDPKFIPHPATYLNQERWLDKEI